MATITERQPGVYFARVFLPPTAAGEKGRQVGKVFRGGKKAVRAEVAEWEASLRGTAPGTVGATVADLLEWWQQAKAFDWQPTTVAAHRSRASLVAADLGMVRLVDLDPFRIDAWLAQMRRDGVGEGAIRSRVGSLRTALSWGISRRMLRFNPVAEAAPSLKTARRTSRPEPPNPRCRDCGVREPVPIGTSVARRPTRRSGTMGRSKARSGDRLRRTGFASAFYFCETFSGGVNMALSSPISSAISALSFYASRQRARP